MSSAETAAKPHRSERSRTGPRNLFRRFLSLMSIATLFFVLGAAVIFFELPSSLFLRRAFVGGAAWFEAKQARPPRAHSVAKLSTGRIDRPDKTCDGFTLCMYGEGSQAVLLNMTGEVVHKWSVPFSKIWPAPPHLSGQIDDVDVHFEDGHIYPNGDLVAVIEGPASGNNPSNGRGLVKLDRNSNVLWSYAESCHHAVDVGEDGTLYVLSNAIEYKLPSELDYIPTPCMLDFVDILSPAGKRLKRIKLLEAFANSPYTPLLGPLEPTRPSDNNAPARRMGWTMSEDQRRRDVLHTNAVQVLTRARAPKFPLFKAGQLLISPRSLDTIAVLDPDSGKIVWAMRGPWRAQHDPSFLDNGHLLLFDNLGAPSGSRVLELNPANQAFAWSYPGTRGVSFLSQIRGQCQRLPNGNTLIVNSDGGEAFEVTPQQETVWSISCGVGDLKRARRYLPAQLPFLEGKQRARP